MTDNIIYLHNLKVRELADKLYRLRNHANTIHNCEKVVYFIDKALAELDANVAGQLAVISTQSSDEVH
ncbi:hypothetical protein JNB88_30695 [Rhizobium cauense]|uniref:hypothetical protein n=1 Tax=Rhizobium cauense TaxID=1166683 RepID=UPI001C6ECA2F|nr:hypothetical protein [Rhizobium cauense]MBW9117988.1 hypothetical protein [Rhizobium cauense]